MFILDTLFKMKENLKVPVGLNFRDSKKKSYQRFVKDKTFFFFLKYCTKAVRYMSKQGTKDIIE